MLLIKTAGLFALTAVAEIVGCFLPYLWLRKKGSIWLRVVDGVHLTPLDWLGACVALIGMSIIVIGWNTA